MLLFSLSMISWENSQSTDIALHMMKENASFGTGFHLSYYFDDEKGYYMHKTTTLRYLFLLCLCHRIGIINCAKKLMLIICILDFKLAIFEVSKNRSFYGCSFCWDVALL